jgi:hypothetical protein
VHHPLTISKVSIPVIDLRPLTKARAPPGPSRFPYCTHPRVTRNNALRLRNSGYAALRVTSALEHWRLSRAPLARPGGSSPRNEP